MSGGGHDWRDRAIIAVGGVLIVVADRARPGAVAQSPRCRAMTIRWTSFVPSPISRIFWSR